MHFKIVGEFVRFHLVELVFSKHLQRLEVEFYVTTKFFYNSLHFIDVAPLFIHLGVQGFKLGGFSTIIDGYIKKVRLGQTGYQDNTTKDP